MTYARERDVISFSQPPAGFCKLATNLGFDEINHASHWIMAFMEYN
jgi:hypothetical protein